MKKFEVIFEKRRGILDSVEKAVMNVFKGVEDLGYEHDLEGVIQILVDRTEAKVVDYGTT